MASTVISVKQYEAYMLALGHKFMPAVERGIKAGAMRCIPLLQERTEQAPPASDHGTVGAFDTGAYKRAWKTAPLPNGTRLYNARPYAAVIDYGRRASPVSRAGINNLRRWAKRKLSLDDDAARDAAFAIAKTLARRPLRARRVLSGAPQEQLTKLVIAEVEHELDKALGGHP